MMRAAEKIGMIKEAQIRKVRYWKGHYYDSVKYGIIREEWEADKIVPIPDSYPNKRLQKLSHIALTI